MNDCAECRVFIGAPILNADGDCLARGWVWLDGEEQRRQNDDHRVVVDPAKLTAVREAAGLSMNALAAVAGVTQKNVAFIEKGRRQYTSGSVVKRLARALGIEEGVLVG